MCIFVFIEEEVTYITYRSPVSPDFLLYYSVFVPNSCKSSQILSCFHFDRLEMKVLKCEYCLNIHTEKAPRI